ncbi:hypothetical protein [Pseudomonas sp. PB120]|uniref:hypothetical protein n=1 Tax=Pseudomonas sp. PB120 TaxID=2494700 RepID=UPI002113D17A|nr:hypothetical protein [Pseudomonas sp. PB120]
MLVFEHRTADLGGGEFQGRGGGQRQALFDGEKTQQLAFTRGLRQPSLELALEIVHVGKFDQAFPRGVERDFAVVGPAHGEGPDQWNAGLARQRQQQPVDEHRLDMRFAGRLSR